MSPPSPAELASLAGPHWQRQLRHSVRLYLALDDPEAPALHVEARLRLVERQLLHRLRWPRPGEPPLALDQRHAYELLEAAQKVLLACPAQVRALLREFSLAQALAPTGQPPAAEAGFVRPPNATGETRGGSR